MPIEGGAKLSGRAGRWTIGTLAIRQEEFQTVEASDLFVARVTANVLAESSVGFIATNGDPLTNVDNSVAGVDFRLCGQAATARKIERKDMMPEIQLDLWALTTIIALQQHGYVLIAP